MNNASAINPTQTFVFAPGLRLARILWRVLPWFAFTAAGLFALWLFKVSSAVMGQARLSGMVVLLYAVLAAIVRELFSPDRPWLRMVPVSDLRAQRLSTTLRGVLFFLLLSSLGIRLVVENGWHREAADLLRVTRSSVLVFAGAFVLGTTKLFRWMRALPGDSWAQATARFLARFGLPVAVLTTLFCIIASGLGYLPLSAWVARNAVLSMAKVLAAILFFRWIRQALYRTVRFYTAKELGEAVAASAAGVPADADAVALGAMRIGGGILKFAIILATVVWVLRSWSVSPGAVVEVLDTPITGSDGLTWAHVLRGIGLVVLTLFFGWFVRGVLSYFIFPRSRVSVGARYAVLAVLHYLVVALAIIFALAAFGVDTASLGWFFGAAGIGLAFGLQDIIGNFISGLIMLVEQPMRVGDLVQIGEATGTVENIHMRGTTLRTFDNTSVLIPNSQMLGERVTNLTHGMGHTRMKVMVGVPHKTDPNLVKALLLASAAGHPEVLEEPVPWVVLDGFGPSSLDFTLVCYTGKLRGRLGISSALRFDILDRLEEAGIQIPHPQQDLHVKSSVVLPAAAPKTTEGGN